MFHKYQYDTKRRNSTIIANGTIYSPISKPNAGSSADNRFFGRGNEKVFLVKRPKYYNRFGQLNDDEIQKIDARFEDSFRKECELWNLVYPNNKADLFTEKGLRLVLPYLPGDTLGDCLSDDELTRYQQLLSVAYSISELNQLGYTYCDFNLDNVLIDKKPNGEFRAYLIDFGGVESIQDHLGANQELAMITHLIPGSNWQLRFNSSEKLIKFLLDEINTIKDAHVPINDPFKLSKK